MGTISASAHGVWRVSSSAINPTTTLSGAKTMFGSADSQNGHPGNPPARVMAAPTPMMPTMEVTRIATTRDTHETGSATSSGGSSESTASATASSATDKAALNTTLAGGCPCKLSTTVTATSRAAAVQKPPTSTRPTTTAISVGESA